MSLQFILGDASKNHDEVMLEKAVDWLERPKQEVFFLVPNYNKFEREREILHGLKEKKGTRDFASIRAQVYSFHRLAWYFLQHTGLLNSTAISETGSAMILRRLLLEMEEELVLFRGEINKSGFIQQLLVLYQEMQTSNLSAADFLIYAQHQIPTVKNDDTLKFSELAKIFQRYEEELYRRDVQVEQPVTLLTRYLQRTATDSEATLFAPIDLKNALFLISGFSSFTAQEQELIKVLMAHGHVGIDLLLDQPAIQSPSSPLDLFYETGRTYHLFYQFAQSNHINVLFDVKCLDTLGTPAMVEIEAFWRSSQKRLPLSKGVNLDQGIELWKVGNPEEEIRQIAAEIRRLVSESEQQERPIRYRDIQILTIEPTIYHQYLPKILTEYEIPYYLDEERMMAQHPLVEFLQSLFSLENYHYQINDIFRLLRTELYLPQRFRDYQYWQQARDEFRKLVDITENKVLAHHYQGTAWTKKQDWQLIEYNFEEAKLEATKQLENYTNGLRQDFRRDIVAFLKKLKEMQTNRDAAAMLYHFLLQAGVEDQLIQWRDQAIAKGELDQARNHEQTWQALMNLLDEFVDIYGDEAFEWAIFEEIFTTGLENLTFGKIPSAIDQVNINRFDLARPGQAKISFVPGLNDTVLPQKTENKTLLTNEERQRLNRQFNGDKFLRDTLEESTVKEPFNFYQVLLSATEKIYLSYAVNFDTQQNLQMSSYLRRFTEQLDLVVEERGILDLNSPAQYYVGTYRSLIYQLNNLHRQATQMRQPLPTPWQGLEQALLGSDLKAFAQKVFASQTHQNIPVSLTKELALGLYGETIYSSISRMETLYQCEYRYFVEYGLKLKEREIYGLNPAMTGEFFHDALDQFLKTLFAENLSLTTITEEQRQLFVEQVLINIFGEARYQLLTSSARMNFIRYQLAKTIQRVSWALLKQSQRMDFSPEKTEVLFGQIAGQRGIKGLEVPLSTGGHLYIRGKIDRIDTAETAEAKWLSVVDYKSSSRDFDVTEAYYGLAMQLITYLDVALKDAVELVGTSNVKPAGAYYLHVHDPLLDGQNQSEEERLKRYKYDGLFLDEPALFPALDHSLDTSKNSLLFPIRKDKQDTYQKVSQIRNKFYTEEEIELLRQHNQKNMKDGAERLLAGEIALNPSYKVKDKKRACQYCPLRSICHFDVMLKENDYHRLENLSKEEIMRRIMEENNGKHSLKTSE